MITLEGVARLAAARWMGLPWCVAATEATGVVRLHFLGYVPSNQRAVVAWWLREELPVTVACVVSCKGRG